MNFNQESVGSKNFGVGVKLSQFLKFFLAKFWNPKYVMAQCISYRSILICEGVLYSSLFKGAEQHQHFPRCLPSPTISFSFYCTTTLRFQCSFAKNCFFLFLFSFNGLKFRYSEKATKSLKIFQFVLNVISKQSGRFLLNFVNFSKYLNFKQPFLPPSLPATHMLWVDSFS